MMTVAQPMHLYHCSQDTKPSEDNLGYPGEDTLQASKKSHCQWNNTEVDLINFNTFLSISIQEVYTVHNIIQIRSERQIDNDT